VILTLALFLVAPQESDAARTARADLARVRASIEKLVQLQERLQKNNEQFRAGSEDEERLKKLANQRAELAREFQGLRTSTIRDMDQLIASASEGLKGAPEDPGLLEVRGEAYLLYDKKAKALADLSRLLRIRPANPELTLKVAKLDQSLNHFEAAVAGFEGLLAKGPLDPETRSLLAMSLFSIHRFDEAARLFDELLKEKKDPQQEELSRQFQKMALEYVDLWKAEQEIRARETKADDLPRVRLLTSRGTIVLELFENEAPNTVANFLELVTRNYYDGLLFHRVIPGFMAQGGCPKGDGSGGPGYRFKDEVTASFRRHFRGSLSMANSGPDTNGSQFFLTHLPTEWLNGKHTVFGRVLQGQEVVDDLEPADTILKAEVLRKRSHPYKVARIEDPPKGDRPGEEKKPEK
jgi:cyclophilin family peptidyl-prolyl cis-trans isomerase/Flp pilus assembly protein TadD